MSNCDKVIAALNFLELRPRLRTYEGRFLTQKTTFLAQMLGLSTDYRFTPYLSGPYSPSLAKDYYHNSAQFNSLETNFELTGQNIQELTKLKSLSNFFTDHLLMEGTSSVVHYMKTIQKPSDQTLLSLVHNIKPHLTEDTLFLSITRAKEILFKPEYLTRELKAELDSWTCISETFEVGR